MPSARKTIIALLLLTAVSALPTPQHAGEGVAANSLFSDTDDGIGYSIKDAEEDAAGLVTSIKGGSATTTTGSESPPPPPSPRRRQANKICDGFQELSNAVGTGSATSAAMVQCDNVDGELTDGAAQAGASWAALRKILWKELARPFHAFENEDDSCPFNKASRAHVVLGSMSTWKS